jgi:uncharacterized protein
VPALHARVTDVAGLLPPERAQQLEATLAQFEAETSHQIAVLTVPTTDGEAIEPFALRVAESWKLGHEGADNGILLVVASKDRKARIEAGYGLEGAVPDAIAKRVIEDVMIPHFRDGDMAGGIEAATDALMKAARGEAIPFAERSQDGPDHPVDDPLGFVFFVSLIASVIWLPFRGAKLRPLGALLSGVTAAVFAFLMLRMLSWSAVAFGIAALFGWLGPSMQGIGGRRGGFGRGGFSGGGGGGGFGGGGGGGFSGGGGSFGGGGASGGW